MMDFEWKSVVLSLTLDKQNASYGLSTDIADACQSLQDEGWEPRFVVHVGAVVHPTGGVAQVVHIIASRARRRKTVRPPSMKPPMQPAIPKGMPPLPKTLSNWSSKKPSKLPGSK